MTEHELLDQALTTGSITPQHCDTVEEVYGSYYREKGREIPRTSSLSSEALKLWRAMEQAAHAYVYQDAPLCDLEEAIDDLVSHPGCTWKRSTIEYWIRQHYYK